MLRLVLLLSVAVATVASGVPKKPKPKSPPSPKVEVPCADFASCMRELNETFETADFEKAQRLVARTETFAASEQQKAQLLAVRGALDAQSLGLTAEAKETVKRSFAQAQRLDPSLTFMAIPAFARTEALESLWTEARPVVEPKVEVRTQLVEVPVAVQPPPPAKRFPVITTVLLGSAVVATGVGIGFGVSASSHQQQAQAAPWDAQRFEQQKLAQGDATVANVTYVSAGVLAAAAFVVFLAVEK